MSFFLKDPDATLDWAVDWGAGYLGDRTIVDSRWHVAPAEVEGVVVAATMLDTTTTMVTLSGGKAGHVYRVGNMITLDDGQCDERSVTIRVDER